MFSFLHAKLAFCGNLQNILGEFLGLKTKN